MLEEPLDSTLGTWLLVATDKTELTVISAALQVLTGIESDQMKPHFLFTFTLPVGLSEISLFKDSNSDTFLELLQTFTLIANVFEWHSIKCKSECELSAYLPPVGSS